MASHGRPGEKTYHQDYIARIRYENNLPPPPGAPKLLNIPIEGLNYYTSAAFASRLVRQQPLNIEADAELGMPIDLVGMPGIFDGDESSIQAPLAIPPAHPKDKLLLRRLADLGKPKYAMGSHSFLRRTEYISTDSRARAEAHLNATKGSARSPTSPKIQRRQSDASKEDPLNIMRHVVKGFDLANPDDKYEGPDDSSHLKGAKSSRSEIDAWENPKHPSKPWLTCVDHYDLKPDLEALPESGTYYTMRFQGQPTSSVERHDPRIDMALLCPIETGDDGYNYEFYMIDQPDTAKSLKRKFESTDPETDDQSFKYRHVRTYETVKQTQSFQSPYREVALALHDGGPGSRLEKGAYFYPIGMRVIMKPRRSKNLLSQSRHQDIDESRADEINLTFRDADEREVEKRKGLYKELLPGAKATNGVEA